jgi:hypothetical protein
MSTMAKQLYDFIKESPRTGDELIEKFGHNPSSTVFRMIKYGAVERFDEINDKAEKKYSRFVVTKYRVIGEYNPIHGSKAKKTITKPPVRGIEKAIELLTKHGYTVLPPNAPLTGAARAED